MKKIKLLISAVVMLLYIVINGCSENNSNPQMFSTEGMKSSSPVSKTEKLEVYVKLKPGSSVTFDRENTSLEKFYSIDVKEAFGNPSDEISREICSNLYVAGDYDEHDGVILGCRSYDLDMIKLFVQNRSDKVVDLYITITGKLKDSKVKY